MELVCVEYSIRTNFQVHNTFTHTQTHTPFEFIELRLGVCPIVSVARVLPAPSSLFLANLLVYVCCRCRCRVLYRYLRSVSLGSPSSAHIVWLDLTLAHGLLACEGTVWWGQYRFDEKGRGQQPEPITESMPPTWNRSCIIKQGNVC